MDRSFLSQPDVIAASRRFVCIRLTTYENEAETKFMENLFVGRSGEVENTTLALLAPDGKTRLARVGRSTRGLFTDAADMAKTLERIASRYPATDAGTATPALPIALDARLGLNVAASDGLPLAVVVARDASTRIALERRLAELAWSEAFVGRFTYATAATPDELKSVPEMPAQDGIVLIAPDTYGQKGRIVAKVGAAEPAEGLTAALRTALAAYHAQSKDARAHRLQGQRDGAFWETKLPVTDPQEARQRERTKQAIGERKP